METSFYSFSHHIFVFHKIKFSFVRYDSGRTITEDRNSSLRIIYWAPILVNILYDFWECLQQSERGKSTHQISYTLGQKNLKLLLCISRRRLKWSFQAVPVPVLWGFQGRSQEKPKEIGYRVALSNWTFCNDGNVLCMV